MSVIDDVQQANRRFAQAFGLGHLPMPPAKKLAIEVPLSSSRPESGFIVLPPWCPT